LPILPLGTTRWRHETAVLAFEMTLPIRKKATAGVTSFHRKLAPHAAMPLRESHSHRGIVLADSGEADEISLWRFPLLSVQTTAHSIRSRIERKGVRGNN
jgi:hypothetical protein